jgi:thiol-disulfide isomerase/thioredoxin
MNSRICTLADRTGFMSLLLFGALTLAVLSGCHKQPAKSAESPPVVSAPPPHSYPVPTVNAAAGKLGWTIASAQHVRLADYQDKVVVLDFYATWCVPCRESVPNLVRLQQRYGTQGLQVVGLNVGGDEDREKVPAFAREFHIQYQLGIPDPELASLYMGGEDAIPQTIVLDRQGRALQRFLGYDESVDQELEATIKSSLSAKPASVKQP